MKEIYYVYNNEAISSCTLFSILNEVKELDIARACLILPFLLDDRTTNYLLRNEDTDLDQLIKEKPRLFVSFNKRYLSLLPVTINSLMLLNKSKQIVIGEKITTNNSFNIDNFELGERFIKINRVIPKFVSMTEKLTTEHLYKIFKIQL